MKSLHKCCVPELPSLGTLSLGELLRIDKPGRYLGGEVNSIVKSEHDIDVHVALCFPDAYEIGMSHLGLQILYDLFNRDERAWAERVFMPFPDMEAALRANAQRLSSLESNRALKEFDVAGFSLQYELAATNVLAMLELGGVGLYAAERPDDAPLVIGGGPLAMHPEPFAAFFDAFFLGDAEDFVSELLGAVRTAKSGTRRSRQKLLAGLRRSGGFYIPQDFVPRYAADGTLSVIDRARAAPEIVERRVLPELRAEAAPGKFIVPNIRTVHDRLNIEVMRGCIRGCRFCQAGYIYRPQRELAPERVLERIRSSAGQTGFEEVSLLSLSTADYCAITPLLKRLMDQYAEDDVLSVSMPSTRVDALSAGMLEQIRRVKKSGFTIAPEAGTQRLRDVINKNLAD
ncbi:MAG TPA: radical SAM protein, partial [Oligoflexia bacterium]|nr:radical SAM protein [Oligoflexia bacterium]